VNTAKNIPDPEVARNMTSRMNVRTDYGLFYLNLTNLQLFLKSDPFFFVVQQPYAGLGSLIVEVSRSHSHYNRQDLPGRGVGPSQWPLPDKTRHSQETDIHASGGVRTRTPSKRAAADLHCRPRDHRDRLTAHIDLSILVKVVVSSSENLFL
jgi:hypothetical protein